jgi:hypothetical protein
MGHPSSKPKVTATKRVEGDAAAAAPPPTMTKRAPIALDGTSEIN